MSATLLFPSLEAVSYVSFTYKDVTLQPYLQKTLAYSICIAKERRRRKNAADRKKGVVREIPASPSAVFRGVSYLLHPGHEYELGPESQRDRGPVDFEYAGALGNGKFAAVGLATALPSVIIPCTTHRRLYSFSESALLLSLRSPYISVFHDDVPLVVSTCVSPTVVLPGAKVALEQPSSSTSFAISLESSTSTPSTCRSSYSLFNDCCLCPTLW